MKYLLYISCIVLSALAIQSCSMNALRGNGKIVENEISISDYKEISIEGMGRIVYEQKATDIPYLRIVTDENIYPLLIVNSDNGNLSIRNSENVNPTKLEIYTNSSGLEKLNVSGNFKSHLKGKLEGLAIDFNIAGAGSILSDSLVYNSISADIAGTSSINLKGKTTYLECNVAGVGKVDSFELSADSVTCIAAGMGNFKVYADKYLKVEMSGMGVVKYKGHPEIFRSTYGMGKISDAN